MAILLVAGEREARLLAVHPHRAVGAAGPQVAATLTGPGWRAAFSETLEPDSCAGSDFGLSPAVCLGAQLSEAIEPRTGYGIEGTAPLGSFSGSMVVPAPPVLHVGAPDTVRLVSPQEWSMLELPVRYQAGSEVGTLMAEVLDVRVLEDDGTETERGQRYLGAFPRPLEGDGRDTVQLLYRDSPVRFSLRIVGLGRHYTSFLAHTGSFPLPQPWQSFGIEGNGTYGYFDGVAGSRAVPFYLTGAVAVSGPRPGPRGTDDN